MNLPFRAVALLCLAFSLHVAHGQTTLLVDKAFARNLTPAELKRVYLACDLASSRTQLAMHEVFRCSIVHEELKQRVFGGDFDQLLAWWRAQRSVEGPTASGAAP